MNVVLKFYGADLRPESLYTVSYGLRNAALKGAQENDNEK
jgi:hypothetical protein